VPRLEYTRLEVSEVATVKQLLKKVESLTAKRDKFASTLGEAKTALAVAKEQLGVAKKAEKDSAVANGPAKVRKGVTRGKLQI
jgi:hypothetical protein